MTNKPMLSVELLPCPFCGSPARLEDHRLVWCVRCTKCSACVLGDRAPEPHGDGLSSDEVQYAQAAAMSENTDWAAYEKSAVHAWNLRSEPAAQHQGEPVAYWYVGDVDGYGCLYTAPDKDGIKIYAEHPAPVIRCSFCDVTDNAGNPWSGHHESVDGKLIYRVMGCKDHKHLVEALDGSKSTPVEDHTQCEECKGWGYHENHHDGGGTECGECGGSGNAAVAVVMVIPWTKKRFRRECVKHK